MAAMGWNIMDQYTRLNESVEIPQAPPPPDTVPEAPEEAPRGGSAEAQRRWGRAGRQVTASLGAVNAMLGGQSLEDFAAHAATRRAMLGQKPLSARTSVNTEGGLAFDALIVPSWEPDANNPSSSSSANPSSSSSDFGTGTLLLPMGTNNQRGVVLVDLSGQSPERVAIEVKKGEIIYGHMQLAPCGRRVCCMVGIGSDAGMAMYQIDAEVPWPKLWSKSTPGNVIDVDFSLDGAFVASVYLHVDCVDIHDAATGALCKTVPFGGCHLCGAVTCFNYIVRFSEELLVVKGGFKSAHGKAVGVWSLDSLDLRNTHEASAEPSQLLEFDFAVGPIALCEKYLVVSSIDGRVSMHKMKEGVVQPWPIRIKVPDEALGQQVMAVSFSHDSAMLAVAWAFGDVIVYSVNSTAQTTAFHQDDCAGLCDMPVLRFSLDDSILVMGGGSGASVSVHRVAPLGFHRCSIPGGKSNDNPSSAAVSTDFVALVTGTKVVVQRHNGEEVADIDTGEPITCAMNSAPVALRPTESDVAVILSMKSVASYNLQSRVLNWQYAVDGQPASIRYSPNGAFVVVAAYSEVVVLDAGTGRAVHTFPENIATWACFDPTSTQLFVGAYSNEPQYVVDLASGTKVHSFDQEVGNNLQGSFDETGKRLAYDATDPSGASSVVVRVLGDPEKRISLFEKEGGEAQRVPKGFCGDWLLVTEFHLDTKTTSEIALVNCAREYTVAAELNELLPIILGTGFTAHSSVGWVPGAATPTIHALVGSELVFVELERFEAMIRDGCFNAKSLMALCGDGTSAAIYQPEMISAIVARFPYCVNITTDVGDTVLHYCARKHRTGAVQLWLPLKVGVYTPVSSGEHSRVIGGRRHYFSSWTALHEAIARNETRMVEHFIVTLTTTVNDVTATLISGALSLMVLVMSHFVPRALILLDERLVRKETTIETHIYTREEAFVSGRSRLYANEDTGSGELSSGQTSGAPIVRMPSASMNVGKFDELEPLCLTSHHESNSGLGDRGVRWGTDPARPSEDILPSAPVVRTLMGCRSTKSRLAQVDINIVQLKNLIGPPDTSAEGHQWSLFDAIEDQCDETVYNSVIMKAAVDYKWKQTESWVMWDLYLYLVSLTIASFAIILLAWEASNPWDANGLMNQGFPHGKATTDNLVTAMAVMELLLLMWECLQLLLLGLKRWFTLDNVLDLLSTLLLITTAADYLINHGQDWLSAFVQCVASSVGIGLKCLGLLGYLDSFQLFSKTLHMTKQIFNDIGPYVAVYSVIILALLLFNIANMPNSKGFGQRGTITEGLTTSFLTAWQMGVMGDFDMSSYGDAPNTGGAKIIFLLFSAFGLLIMLNLLIAVMGDSFDTVKAMEDIVAMSHQAQKIGEYERLLVGLGLWKRTNKQKFPRYMELAQEVIHGD